jgi:hypothetical protein
MSPQRGIYHNRGFQHGCVAIPCGVGIRRSAPQLGCFECGDSLHWARDCPKRKQRYVDSMN